MTTRIFPKVNLTTRQFQYNSQNQTFNSYVSNLFTSDEWESTEKPPIRLITLFNPKTTRSRVYYFKETEFAPNGEISRWIYEDLGKTSTIVLIND
jgi:hypothetical protein